MPRRKQTRQTTVKDVQAILRLTDEHGLSVRAVSERLKISKTTVSTYLRASEATAPAEFAERCARPTPESGEVLAKPGTAAAIGMGGARLLPPAGWAGCHRI